MSSPGSAGRCRRRRRGGDRTPAGQPVHVPARGRLSARPRGAGGRLARTGRGDGLDGGRPASVPCPEAQGTVEVRLVGGPDAGRVYRLGPGVAVVGGGPEAWVRPADSSLPSSAYEIDVAVGGTVTVGPSFGSGVPMDGRPVEGPTAWRRRSVVARGALAVRAARTLLPRRRAQALPGRQRAGLRPAPVDQTVGAVLPSSCRPGPSRRRTGRCRGPWRWRPCWPPSPW